MVDRKELPAVRAVIFCTLAAYVAGEHLEFAKAPAKQMLVLATATSTSATSAVVFNPMTFATVEPAPPVVPPRDKQTQG
jgi:hypothetical protein